MADAPLIVLDTHVLVWWLADPAQITGTARKAIRAAARSRQIVVSAASILEIATLIRRGRLALATTLEQWLGDLRALPEIAIVSIDAEIAAQAGTYGDAVHGDPVDRLIIATAQVNRARLISADAAMRSLRIVQVVW
jgi:PIN domain nuclease of toxin-antitoxin system